MATWSERDKPSPGDPVNHPAHYTFGKFEVIDVLQDWFADDPLAWQVVKYIARYRYKGNPIEDLMKARWYLDRRIAELDAKNPVQTSPTSNPTSKERLDE